MWRGRGEAQTNNYQTARLKEKAAPKFIKEETGFRLRLLGEIAREGAFKRSAGDCSAATRFDFAQRDRRRRS
jgi:hypothetical protein